MPWTTPAIVLLIIAALRGGGTLADAAFYESIRRVLTPAATRSLTMADVPRAAPVSVVEPDVAAKPEASAKADEPPAKSDESTAKPGEPSTEMEWRAQITAARTKLEQDEILAEAMQGRVNSLNNEVNSRDDPAQRAELIKQRARVMSETDRMMKLVEQDKLAISAIEDAARKKGIPPGWIR